MEACPPANAHDDDGRIRMRRLRPAGLLVVVAAILAALGYQSLASSSSTIASPIGVLRNADLSAPDGLTVSSPAAGRSVSTVVRRASPTVSSPAARQSVSTNARWARLTAPFLPARRSSLTGFRASPSSAPTSSVPCAELPPGRGRRHQVRRRQWLAFREVPGTTPPAGGPEVRLGSGGCPLGRHPRHVCPRVGGCGRHRARRCRGVAVRPRRRVRLVPDLR